MRTAKELFDTYFEYVGDSEAPKVFHRWALIGILSAALARKVWFVNGHLKIYPNTYLMLMGDPGTRKSTAIGIAKNLLECTGFNNFAASQTSKEQFYHDLENSGVKTLDGICQQFICADEFNNFIGEGNSSFITALTELFDAKDTFDAKFKKGTSIIPFPCVSILGGNTHANFSIAFPPAIIHNGFLSRLILVYGPRTGRKITWLAQPPSDLKEKLVEHLSAIQENLHGRISCTPEAAKALDEIYQSWEELEDPRFSHYAQRRNVHLQKLCLICACGTGKMTLEYPDVIYANTLLHSAEDSFPQALGEFGKSRTSEEASVIMNIIYSSKTPVPMSVLYKSVQGNISKFAEFQEIVAGLVQAQKITNCGKGYSAVYKPQKFRIHCNPELLT